MWITTAVGINLTGSSHIQAAQQWPQFHSGATLDIKLSIAVMLKGHSSYLVLLPFNVGGTDRRQIGKYGQN